MTSEIDLVRRAIGGERDAFGDLLRQHDPAMRKAAWRIVGRAGLVDDALQDAYLRAYRSIGGFRSDGPFGAWLRRIVVNSCLDHLRRRARREEEPLEADTPPSLAVPSAADALADAERLHRALRNLPDDQRVALVLIEWEGYSYSEVADLTDTTPGNVGSRVSRARATLRAVLREP